MRYSLSLLAIIFAATCGNAQTVEFIEPRNVQNVPEAEFSTFKVGDNLYVLQKKYRMMAPVSFDLQLDAYDVNRKPIGSYQIDKTLEMGDANIYEGIFPMKEQLVMFKSEYSKSSGAKMSYLWYYSFDVTGRRQPKKQLLTIDAESAFNSGNFSVNVSPDGTKLAVISELPYDKDGNEKCKVTVFDNGFKQIWKKEYTFPYESSKAPKNDVFVNNEGVAFILKRIKIKKQFDKFSVFTFSGNGQTVTESKVELGNAFTISTYKNLFDKNGDLVLAGYYYTDKNVGVNVETPDGTFFLTVNASNGELSKAKNTPFKPLTLTATQLLSTNDGEYVLIGEQQLSNSKMIPGKSFEYTYDYTTRNIQLTKLTGNGDASWNYLVEKELKSANDGGRFLSSYAWVSGDDIKLLFADYLSDRDGKKRFVVGPGLAGLRVDVIETIGSDGKLKSASYITDQRIGGKRGEYMFIPSTATVWNNSSLFLLSARGLELVGTRLTY